MNLKALEVRARNIGGEDRDWMIEAVVRARGSLLADQRPDGRWCYELEADCTIPGEYAPLLHDVRQRRPELRLA